MDVNIIYILFAMVYVSMAIGHLPGLNIDRSGAAILGAMLLIASGAIGVDKAWQAIGFSTIGTLFGLMLVSASFVEGGFYHWTADKLAALPISPPKLMAVMIVVCAALSAILTNDVVMVAMTPVVCAITVGRKQNPVPFLLAMVFAANIGSTATLIGSPRNIILAEAMHVSFAAFSVITLLPVVVSLLIVWFTLLLFYNNKWQLQANLAQEQKTPTQQAVQPLYTLDKAETIKASLVTLGLILAFIFTDWPHVLIALGAGGILMLNRTISSHNLIQHVDGNLLLMLMGLFVVNEAMASTGAFTDLMDWLHTVGINLHSVVQSFFVTAVISDVIGNSSTMMLITPFLTDVKEGAALLTASMSIGTGFSSNLVIFGSLAGIIAVEQAKANGVTIGFREFSRAGIPITIVTMVLSLLWVYWY